MEIDCRGLNCPEPVLRTKKALEEDQAETLIVIVDNETARENILRFTRNRGLETTWQGKEGAFQITVTGNTQPVAEAADEHSCANPGHTGRSLIMICSDQLGQGSGELGRLLMRNFIYTLTKHEDTPEALVFMNAGVKLCTENSPVLDELSLLQDQGVAILACGTCLDYYRLKDKLKAGRVTNMYDVTDLLANAGRIINL
ncbi:MAG: sulfurtransferase-like selenium metabolism protein YedF [Bacillota bacterium]